MRQGDVSDHFIRDVIGLLKLLVQLRRSCYLCWNRAYLN